MFSRLARFGRLSSRVLSRGVATQARSAPSKFRTILAGASLLGALAYAAPAVHADEKVPVGGLPGTQYERTFIAIKPDGVQRGLIAEIIKRFEQKGYTLVGIKILRATPDMARAHYDDLKHLKFFPGLVEYFSSGPIVAMVWQGKDVIKNGRLILGATRPSDATPGSIRGDLCIDVGRNVCHGSDGPESAQKEVSFWFKESEVCNWTPSNINWVIGN
eukprot:TRINITY_DN777_c0_g1_i2.p1 TRINITY_DN777_c0_g1~~TRINITY_DN777_c0_g1_i2.p1  ORF type:complete len:217 (-),score=80.67 TRINITY_DN777_c0_g1_i2:103-753(-)